MAIARADGLLCVSHATLAALRAMFRVDESACHVVYQAYSQINVAPHRDDSSKTILYVGELRPHKNLRTLIRAMSHVRTPNARLILVGPTDREGLAAVRSAVADANVYEKVEHRGFVAAAELDTLYGSSTIFAFPSLHEGFGLPILEAMSAGLPVVLTDMAVTREASGGIGRFVSRPLDPSAWASEIDYLLSDKEARDSLSLAGRQQAGRFTSSRMAAEFLQAVHS